MNLSEKVYEKLSNEYDEFIRDLKAKSIDSIIESSYEKVIKEETKEMFYPNLYRHDDNQLKQLLKCSNALNEIYYDWLKEDGGINYDLGISIENTLDRLEKKSKDNIER